MDSISSFVVQSPGSAAAAVALLMAQPTAKMIAGGTDLIPNLRHGIGAPDSLIDLSQIDELNQIEHSSQGWIIGAGVTLAQLATHADVHFNLSALTQAAAAVAGPGHRSVATLGGNLCLDTRCMFYNQSEWWRASNNFCLKRGGDVCHVAPQGKRCHAAWSGDLAPALMALNASIDILGPNGSRQLPLSEFYVDDGAQPLKLAAAELITAVRIPAPAVGARSGYRKARIRDAIDFPLAGVAVCCIASQGVLAELRVALTGTNSRPFLLTGTEALCHQPVTPELLSAMGKLVQKQVNPMRTTGASAAYRRQVASVMAQRLIRELVEL
jgi:4-hydroxybenzoyl-CoA reductase subunit beta